MRNTDQTQALEFFNNEVLPRRVERQLTDREKAKLTHKEQVKLKKKDEKIFRKVAPGETDRGEPYPVWMAGIKTFSNFGEGIGKCLSLALN